MPRQLQPDAIRLEYYKALVPFVREAWRAFASVRGEILRLLERERYHTGKQDGANEDAAKALIDRARALSVNELSKRRLEETARKFGRRTSDFQREQLNKQVEASMGVPLSSIEKPITAKIEAFTRENVDLIVTVQERFFDRLRDDVEDAFTQGMRPETLAERFQSRDGMSERDAMRIARDQIGKLNAQVNEERQKGMGVDSYIWRTVQDNRVRDSHDELDGQTFKWDDPPMGGGTGPDEAGHPGTGIQCRCYSEPVFDDILAALE